MSYNLENTGLEKNVPNEILMTTYSEEKKPQTSIIGVWPQTERKIKFKIFEGSKTLENLNSTKEGAINIFSDAKNLIKKGLKILPENTKNNYKKSDQIEAPLLECAKASVEFRVKEKEPKIVEDELGKSKLFEITSEVVNINLKEDIKPRPFKRPEFHLLESAIKASRAKKAKMNGKKKVFKKYSSEIKEMEEKCSNISQKNEYLSLIKKIRNNI